MKFKDIKFNRQKDQYFDYTLLFLVLFLLCFGWVMLYSTSSYMANLKFGDSTHYLKRQIAAAVIGLIGMYVLSKVDCHVWKPLAPLAYVFILILNVSVMFLGKSANGQARWFKIGSMSLQPSELAKIICIFYLAVKISEHARKLKSFWVIILYFVFMAPILAAIAATNLSTAVILAGVIFIMLFVTSSKYKDFLMLIGVFMGFAIVGICLASYRVERLKVWLDPEGHDKGFQTLQALYAIASGQLFGKGLGQSMQKMGFIPEVQNDMIFSIICEELGFFGAFFLLIIFLMIFWRLMIIASNAKDLYSSLLVVGVMAHLAIQVLLNIGVVTNTIPNTGVTLPFVSYGGTAIVCTLAEIGLVLNVSRQIKVEGTV